MASPAAAYPDRPVKIVIPLTPGGVVDVVARVLQPHLEKALGQPVVIEHRPGASGLIGGGLVASAEPDGHTLLMAPTTFTINPAVHSKMPFDPVNGFEPVAVLARNSLIVLINPQLKATTMKEFVALAKARPGQMNYATPGASSQAQLLMELWSAQAGIKMQHLPYRGGMPAVMATVTGEADITLIASAASLAQIEGKKLRPLASGGATREAKLPDVPTTAEAGFPDFKAVQWVGLLAPAKTPRPVLERLNKDIQTALALKEVRDNLDKQGMVGVGGPADDFRALIAAEIAQWTEVARRANIRMD